MPWTIIIVCAIYAALMYPIEKVIKRRIRGRMAFIAQFVISLVILLTLYGIATILGY